MSVDTTIPSVVILDPIQRAIKPLVIESIVRVARSREPAICAGDLPTHARIPRAPGARSLAICVMGECFFLKGVAPAGPQWRSDSANRAKFYAAKPVIAAGRPGAVQRANP